MLRILTATSALALAAALPAMAQDAQAPTEPVVQEAPPELGAPEPMAPVSEPAPMSAPAPAASPEAQAPADPAVTPAPAAPAPAAAPAPVDPAATPAAPTPVAAAQPTREQQVAQIVDAEFATYDGDGDGNLTKAEFSKWIIAMRDTAEKQGQELPALDATAKTQWASASFTTADADKSKKISKVEMNTFLVG